MFRQARVCFSIFIGMVRPVRQRAASDRQRPGFDPTGSELARYGATYRAINAATVASLAGDWRANLDHYKTAFKKSDYQCRHRYYLMSGLDQALCQLKKHKRDDLKLLAKIYNDDREHPVVRVFAAESRAKACWRAGERDKAAQDYRRVIDISRKATPEERDLRVELTHPTRLSSSMVWGRVRSGVIIDRHARTAAENLTSIESGAVDYPELRIERDFDDDAFETLSGGEGLPTASSDDMSRTLICHEKFGFTQQQLDWAKVTTGTACNYCGKRAEGKAHKMCRGCNLAAYCSDECAKLYWKGPGGGHKAECRAIDDVRVGDLVTFNVSRALKLGRGVDVMNRGEPDQVCVAKVLKMTTLEDQTNQFKRGRLTEWGAEKFYSLDTGESIAEDCPMHIGEHRLFTRMRPRDPPCEPMTLEQARAFHEAAVADAA